ncbi:hypothetical protein [Moorena sp. SIO3I6]|nr:hypothetical protein [Moorena sp. SIO3I6]
MPVLHKMPVPHRKSHQPSAFGQGQILRLSILINLELLNAPVTVA